MQIGIIILAAGSSSRLGTPKQLIQIEGESLIRKAIKTAMHIQNTKSIVVLGANDELIKPEIADLRINTLFNEAWQSGMASSLKKGLDYLLNQNSDLEAVLVMLCDQPFVNPTLIQNIIQTYKDTSKPIVASDYGENLGVPALFAKPIFSSIFELEGDTGARKIFQKHRQETATLAFPEGKWDIDTQADIEKIQELFKKKESNPTKSLE